MELDSWQGRRSTDEVQLSPWATQESGSLRSVGLKTNLGCLFVNLMFCMVLSSQLYFSCSLENYPTMMALLVSPFCRCDSLYALVRSLIGVTDQANLRLKLGTQVAEPQAVTAEKGLKQ